MSLRRARIPHSQLVISTRQLATLVKAGMPLLRALRTIAEQLPPGRPGRQIFTQIASDVESGVKLSEAFARHPASFPFFYVNMVRAGEVGGLLEEILRRLTDLLEKQSRLRQRVRSALMYPAFVMCAAVGILAILMAFVVPTFLGMFDELGSNLPLPTQILVWACDWIRGWWWLMGLGAVGAAVLFRAARQTPTGRRTFDRLTLRAPVFGSLVQRLLIGRFARTLGTLLASGVPILAALETVRATITNAIIDDALADVVRSLKAGETLAKPIERAGGVFPPLVSRMVALGEETGQLDQMLVQVADSYED